MQRVIIAEDDNLLAGLIEARLAGSFDVVAKVSDGMELIKKFGELKPDMIITDIEMPEMNGLDAAEAIKKKYPSTKIVVITAKEKKHYVLDARDLGVNAILLKRTLTTETFEAVIKLAAVSDHYIEGAGVAELVKYKNYSNVLSRREEEILTDLGNALSYKEIAAGRFISIFTVKNHIAKIKDKLCMPTVDKVRRYAVLNAGS